MDLRSGLGRRGCNPWLQQQQIKQEYGIIAEKASLSTGALNAQYVGFQMFITNYLISTIDSANPAYWG